MKQIKYITAVHDSDLFHLLNQLEVTESDRSAPDTLGTVGVNSTPATRTIVRMGRTLPFENRSDANETAQLKVRPTLVSK